MNKSGLINFRSILETVPFGVLVLNHNLQIVWINKETIRFAEKKNLSAMKGRLCYQVIFSRNKPCDRCPALRCINTGEVTRRELTMDFKGTPRHFLTMAIPFTNSAANGGPMIIELAQDITYHKKVKDQLRHSNELTRTILDNAPISIFTIDINGVFTSMNSVMAQQTGLGDRAGDLLIGRFSWIDNPYTIKCGLADRIRNSLRTGEIVEVWDFPFITYRGDKNFLMNFKGIPLYGADGTIEGLLCIIEDTTERAKTQALLAQEAKMAAVGRLAASIAHNLNNPLATISANAELAMALCDSLEAYGYGGRWSHLRDYHKAIKGQAFRCTDIINDMLKLSRKEGFKWEKLDLNRILSEVIGGLDLKKHRIKLLKVLRPDLPQIECDGWALQQVFLNLLNNAIDALESRPRAQISVKTQCSRNTATVEISDNGIGIPHEIMEKIFEPFFTTKLSKKDLGLGLTFCYEFLREMGGEMKVKSKPGHGTTFRITLPVRAVRE
ncbi:MAG: hypothetical protein H6Q52_95 [Deltaproteobacteria bacterium]|nr:hypothetical protein [Deltaproteobacteria bacterium]